MRYLWIAAAFVAVVGIGSCSRTMIPGAPAPVVTQALVQRVPESTGKSGTVRYIYVADRTAQKLFVYPARVANPKPLQTIAFPSQPIGVATDANGRVYVSLFGTSQVAIFDSGAQHLVDTLDGADGINQPSGVVVDGKGNLWVANRGTSAAPSYVAEYPPGKRTALARVNLPQNFLASGIALDPAGDLFVDMMAQLGGFVIDFPHAAAPYDPKHIIGTAGNGGIAFDGRGFLRIGTLADMLAYNLGNWKRQGFDYYGVGATIHLMTSDASGTLYVPISSASKPEVLVIPAASNAAPYAITQGLTSPSGAAAGI